MQYAKDEIKQRLIDAAKEEFLAKGFENASIRAIAAKANTSKSNLYNYFKDKNNLFCAILEPTVSKIREGLELAKTLGTEKGMDTYTKESQGKVILAVTEFLYVNQTDIRLLLFGARGSSLEGFRDSVPEAFTDILCRWAAAKNPDKAVSRLFVRCVAGFYLNMMEQLLIHQVSRDQAGEKIGDAIHFIYYGWKGVLG